MTIYNLNFVRELVNAFNISNYASDVNTNFVVEDDNIVVKFNCDQGYAKRCLLQMARDLVKEYFPNEYVASHFFDLKSFPFCFNEKWLGYDKETGMTSLTVPIDSGVIFNLKVHFAEGCRIEVKEQMVNEIYKDPQCNVSKECIKEFLTENIQQLAIGMSPYYIKCLLFYDPGIQEHFKQVLQTEVQKYGYNYLDFYHIGGNKIYFKDIENIGFIRSVTEFSKKRIGYHLRFPSSHDLKVRNYKDVIGELIFRLAEVPVCGYYRDVFIDEKRISNGECCAFVPMVKDGSDLKHLDYMEANKVNTKFSYDLLTNIRGQTEGTRSDGFGEVYAFSDRQIALLIPMIMENSVINKDGQLEIDPELPQRLQSPEPSPSRKLSQAQVFPKGNQEERIRESPKGAEKEKGTEALYYTIDLGNLPQQSLSAGAVGASASVQEANISLGRGSLKKHEALQSEGSSSKRFGELEQGAGGGFFSASSESNGEYGEDRAKSKSKKRHVVLCKFKSLLFGKSDKPDENFGRYNVRRGSTKGAPVPRVLKSRSFLNNVHSAQGRRRTLSNLPSEVSSPARLDDTSWEVHEVIVESAPSAEDKSQQLRQRASVSRSGSNRSNGGDFKSADPSPRLSLTLDAANLIQQRGIDKSDRFSGKFSKDGSPDTNGEIKKQLPFIPFPQTKLRGPSSFSAMQYIGARKKITGESYICPTNPWAVPSTGSFFGTFVSHAKSNIGKL